MIYFVISSSCSGSTLYEKLHVSREKLTLTSKLSLSYQIAQALAYLHAKNIVYKHFNTRNIFIDNMRICMSAVDFTDITTGKSDVYVCTSFCIDSIEV